MSTLFDERSVRYMTDLIRDFQFEDYQAAGFPGNFGEESGGFTQVQEIGPSSGRGGLGDGQWTGPRRRDFEAWLARRAQMGLSHAPDDYDANYSMLFRELDGGEGKRVLPKLRQASSVEEATEIVMLEYERPAAATAHLDVRKDYAKKALAAFRARGIDVAALKASGRPGAGRDGEILPPAIIMPEQQSDLIGKLLPVILQSVLPTLVQTIGKAQPDVGKIIAQVTDAVKVQAPAAPAAPQATPASQRPSVWLSTAGAVVAALLQAHGDLGTPVGPNATTTGLMTNVLTVGSTIFGAVGGWQGMGRMALGLFKLLPK